MLYYIVDAFAQKPFEGNPAGVLVRDEWLEDGLMQQIAAENNLSETAFAVREGAHYRLRWFTPAVEVSMCGHATLATAFVILNLVDPGGEAVAFETRSGRLTVTRQGDLLQMDFPVRNQSPVDITETMRRAAGGMPVLSAQGGYNLMLELPDASSVREMIPDYDAICALDTYHGVIVTAPGDDCDFVSRFFAPNMGVNEDPVTGSTHTSLTPYWAARLGRHAMTARQLSRRGGTLHVTLHDDRVLIAGSARLYLRGRIELPQA